MSIFDKELIEGVTLEGWGEVFLLFDTTKLRCFAAYLMRSFTIQKY